MAGVPPPTPERIRNEDVVGRHIAAGNLFALIAANASGPLPDFPEPKIPPDGLTQDNIDVAVAVANGQRNQDIDGPFGYATAEVEALVAIFGLSDRHQDMQFRNDPLRRLLVRCLYTAGIVQPDTNPDLEAMPQLPPRERLCIGLLSHGLTAHKQIGSVLDLTQRSMARLVGRTLGYFADGSLSMVAGVGQAFETGVFSLKPDKIMPSEFLVECVRDLLDRESLVTV